ncbi:Nup188p-like protein [Ophiocordyceps camponoti-floridani]|uniref:Nucleoporin NUP188 n=1 Tax=Ophiocordyceps camponoti-floridani TaxID=2030778 RepID=A0A8H4QDT3_9HYPO|nr:Nup188p-like protein [Ophiocordyceps camponoti-floridani]
MAPVSDSKYFPSLDDCLSGDRLLLSWKDVSVALSDESGHRQSSSALLQFLSDEFVLNLLKDPSTAFAPHNEASEADFKTKTAPVNVSEDGFDIETIKSDAKWLSKTAKINLVAALRVVVIEIQSRPLRHLMGPLSSQDASNLQEAAGLQNSQGSTFLYDLGAASTLDVDEISANFDKPESRKSRLIDTLWTERRSFMMAADYMLSLKLYRRLPILTSVDCDLAGLYHLEPTTDDVASLLAAYLKVVSDCMGSIEAGLASLTDDALLMVQEVELEWIGSLLIETIHAMSVVFQLADSLENEFPPPDAINQWFSLMEVYGFFGSVQPIHPAIADLIPPLTALSCAVSLSLLKPARSLIFLSDREEDSTLTDNSYDAYLLSSDVLEQIHKSIINAASTDCQGATPVVFAWTLLLHRMTVSYQARMEKRDALQQQSAEKSFAQSTNDEDEYRRAAPRRNSAGSIYSIESSKFDGFLENATGLKDMQLVEQLAASVTAHGKVFEVMADMASSLRPSGDGSMTPLISSRVRVAFLELLKVCYPIVGYQSEPLASLLHILAPGHGYWDLCSSKDALSPAQDVVACMLHDDHAMEFYFQQALNRFPYEFSPFITLCRTFCATNLDDDRSDLILGLLRTTPTLTLTLPDAFSGYELVQEDENTNSFCLVQEIPLISLSSSWSRRCIEDDVYRLPSGTYGRFVTDSGRVVVVDYPHSTLSMLGRQLEINLAKEGYDSALGTLQPDDVAEVISLLSTLLRAEHLKVEDTSEGNALIHEQSDLLLEAGRHISGGKDIIAVICETMDYYMQDELAMAGDAAVRVIDACVTFLDATLMVQPNRVWSYLARSELLSSEARAGKLAKITGTLDLVSERFDLLTSSLSFFSNLVDTAMRSGVRRRAGNKPAGRQKPASNPWQGTADRVLSRVSLSLARASIDILESTSTWRFDSETSRLSAMSNVVPVLDKLVKYSYSMGESPSSDSLTSCLGPAASYVVDCFMSPATGTLRYGPILSSLGAAFASSDSTLYPSRTAIVQSQACSMLAFCTTLLRAADYLGRSPAMLEAYLFKSSTLLARLSASPRQVRGPVIRLLESLVSSAGKSAGEPPSLLGYLGPPISKSFLQSLADLGKPFALPHEVKTVWGFFSSIVRNRQQWMSNCLLTGQTPREAMKDGGKKGELAADSVFVRALTKLKRLKDVESVEALAVLDFVSSAQNYWPWTIFTLLRDTSYIEGLQAYVRELKPAQLTLRSDAIGTSLDARKAAYVAETLAMQLYHARHQGTAKKLASSLVADLDYYIRDGVEAAGYNKSLHNNFAKNFATRYSGCSVDLFKRTPLEPRELGANYYYDVERADDMLKFDPAWLGRKGDGFKKEMELANANLSLVDAQIALFHAWEFLLVELGTCLSTDEAVARQMLQVTQQCLSANQGLPGPEAIFMKLVEARANLALILVQRLVKSSLAVKDANQLLATLVGTINTTEDPFTERSITHYRTLLKTLFVTLRVYQNADVKALAEMPGVDVVQTVLNILDDVVGKGFRTLVSFIHERDVGISPEDLALLTAILQACLSLPTMDQSQAQIVNIIASHDTINAATSLFSWADQLAVQGDPVYGELSVLFLLELSSLPLLAEQLACDGVLGNLLSANLARYMLKANISPYADAAISQRCYSIWAKGLLPLTLNLLMALGPTMASEIAYLLNQFSHLLKASVDRFETPSASRTRSKATQHYLTLLATSEIHSLALLTRILAALRVNCGREIPDVEWDAAGLLENVDFWLSTRRLLRERLLPLGSREMEWRNTKVPVGEGHHDNLLECKVVCQLETVRDVLSEELDA